MSVKMMTTDQIHNDLNSIARMWNGGIPMEQADRVNALKAELKRRGVEVGAPPAPTPQAVNSIESMNEEQLAKELSALGQRIGKDPTNEALQEQFANVRFELRKRMTGQKAEQITHTPASHPASQLIELVRVEQGAPEVAQSVAEAHGEWSRPPVPQSTLKEEFLAAQAQHIARAEEHMRKYNLAKIAAETTATLLATKADPNGDDIESACVVGVQVATTIFSKVGL